MSEKTVENVPIRDDHHDHESFIPVGRVTGASPGPRLAVIGGIHGSEYAAHEGVYRFWQDVDPDTIAGTIDVVLAADVTAMLRHFHHDNPIDGENLGRVFPGDPDGTLTEVIAHEITERVLQSPDAVVDCHGGEFNEDIDLYSITYRTGDTEVDEAMMGLARAAGFPFIEVKDATDGNFGGGATAIAAEKGIPAVTIEAGGGGRMEPRHVQATYTGIWNALRHLDMIEKDPVPYDGEPVELAHAHFVRTESAGIFDPVVNNDHWVEHGDHIATIRDFDGSVLEEVHAPDDGVVIMTWDARVIDEGGIAAFIGTIVDSGIETDGQPY